MHVDARQCFIMERETAPARSRRSRDWQYAEVQPRVAIRVVLGRLFVRKEWVTDVEVVDHAHKTFN